MIGAKKAMSDESTDVDGNDYWLWERVEAIRPAVVVIEYTATCRPPVSVVQEHDVGGPRKVKTDYWGASLSALHRLARRKGYQRLYSWTPETLYHPLRRKLIADAFVPGFLPAVGRYEVV